MNKIYVNANNPEDWKQFLAKPDKHWRTGYSVKALAYCWQEADGFPKEIKRVFKESGLKLFQSAELLLAFPEWKVPLPGGSRSAQNDIFIIAKGKGQLISIMVEGKVSEHFDRTIAEWKLESSTGKKRRLEFLCDKLTLDQKHIDHIRYQLLHRTASAIIEAERFNEKNALMMIHSFSQSDEWFEDYSQFLALLGINGITPDSLVLAKNINGVDLYSCWIRGDKKYLGK